MRAARLRRHEEIPQPRGLRLGLDLLDDAEHFPTLAFMRLGIVLGLARTNFAIAEIAHAVTPVRLAIRNREIHTAIPIPSRLETSLVHTRHSVKPPRLSPASPEAFEPATHPRAQKPTFP